MKTNCIIFLISFLSVSVLSFSQATYESYDWDEPLYESVFDEFSQEAVVVLFEHKIIEYFFKGDDFKQIEITHKKVQVNTDNAIEEYNTIYLPVSTDNRSVIRQKTRVIASNGTVKELDNSAIQLKRDEETGRVHRYYAVEGVETASQIEFYYITEDNASYRGTLFRYQDDEVKQKVEFRLLCPDHMFFMFKPLNDAPMPMLDSLGEHNLYSCTDVSVPKLEKEHFANYSGNLKQIIFQLDYIIRNNRVQRNFTNYNEIGQNIYAIIYSGISKAEQKTVQRIIKNAHIHRNDKEEDKIFKLENYLKIAVAIHPNGAHDIATGFSRKIMTENAFMRTLANCFKELGIEHEIVITSNRHELRFLQDFESYLFLREYLIYFPSISNYIAPTERFHRLGLIPHGYIYNYGLFISEVSVAGYVTGVGKVKYIDAPSKDHTYSKMYISVDFSESLENISIDLRKESMGYYAHHLQPYFSFLDKAQAKEIQEEYIRFMTPSVEIVSMKYENIDIVDVGRNPMIQLATLESENFVEIAGDKVLFKVGELIGPQMEMYHEEERKMPLENRHNRLYYREITFDIPEGYTIENLDDIIIYKAIVEEDGSESSLFKSEYTLDGNTVKIISEEYYDKIFYPTDLYSDFQSIINAAADFNKVVFVLSKKI